MSFDQYKQANSRNWLLTRNGIALLGFLVIAGFFLVTEHTAHLLGILPYAVLLACPLLHLFMHGGHGSGHNGQNGGRVTGTGGTDR